MKRFPQFCLFLFFSLSAFALEEGHARYVGGTVPGLTSGVIGRLDTTSTTSLTFARAGNKVEIPYAEAGGPAQIVVLEVPKDMPAVSKPSCRPGLLRLAAIAKMLQRRSGRQPPPMTTRPFPSKLLKSCDLLRSKEP